MGRGYFGANGRPCISWPEKPRVCRFPCIADPTSVTGGGMKKEWRLLGSLFLLLFAGLISLPAWAKQGPAKAAPPPTWVELGENGAIIARQVLTPNSTGQAPTCPSIQINGVATQM